MTPFEDNRIKYLLHKNANKACSEKELEDLYQLLTSAKRGDVNRILDSFYEKIPKDIDDLETDDIDWEFIIGSIITTPRKKTLFKLNSRWIRIAAMIILLMLIGGVMLFKFPIYHPVERMAKIKKIDKSNSGKAVLTFSDGSTIILDKEKSGEVARRGNLLFLKSDSGTLELRNENRHVSMNSISHLNKLETSYGIQYKIVLPDGSKVWLNSTSSISFPSTFDTSSRLVKLDGEAYFEITPLLNNNKRIPFRVEIGNTIVDVLGTHFNVKAYGNELIKVTLIEGSVKIIAGSKNMLLSPNQQCIIQKSTEHISMRNINSIEEIAWKEGYFQFHNEDIQTVMSEAARWYGVVVEYQGNLPKELFVGKIPRSYTLTEFLRVLELSQFHFKIQGKIITVTQ